MTTASPPAPARDCDLCPRLAAFRAGNALRFPLWHNAPVPSFGDAGARLLAVGLGPGLRGANRSGRPFTGDYAGDLLYATLARHGFARGSFVAPREDAPWTGDGLELLDARVTNAVRCVPPANKPMPAEIRACNGFLGAEIALVLFGIGGLVRFRTVFDDPRQTGLAIIAAVLGLACGMSEYALAGIALAVVYLVNWWLTRTTVLRVRVRGRKGADLGALQESVSRELGTRGFAILRVVPIPADRELEFFARTDSDLDLDDLVGALHGAAPGARVRVTTS